MKERKEGKTLKKTLKKILTILIIGLLTFSMFSIFAPEVYATVDNTLVVYIGAHPDDIDIGMSGSLYKHDVNKHPILWIVVTDGGADDLEYYYESNPERGWVEQDALDNAEWTAPSGEKFYRGFYSADFSRKRTGLEGSYQHESELYGTEYDWKTRVDLKVGPSVVKKKQMSYPDPENPSKQIQYPDSGLDKMELAYTNQLAIDLAYEIQETVNLDGYRTDLLYINSHAPEEVADNADEHGEPGKLGDHGVVGNAVRKAIDYLHAVYGFGTISSTWYTIYSPIEPRLGFTRIQDDISQYKTQKRDLCKAAWETDYMDYYGYLDRASEGANDGYWNEYPSDPGNYEYVVEVDYYPSWSYHSYTEIQFGLRLLEYSGIAKVYDIGDSVENRDLWAIKISDNPDDDDADEPDILFVGLHHAREWISAEVPYYLAINLVQTYQSDESVKTLIDNSEIWIVPVLNPDGLEYSRTVDRMWRKNRRDNGDGTFGVDLNRNYDYMWGGSGSSGETSSDIYRGPLPFSEPETVAMRDLISDTNRDFQAVLSYHSYGQLILYPWGYKEEAADDSSTMKALGDEMSDLIKNVHGKYYKCEQSSELYLTSGDLTDWVYGTAQVPAFTIELRPESFDPGFELPESQILNTCEENRPAALYLIRWVVLSQGGFMDFEDGVDEAPIRSTIPGVNFTTTMGYDWVYADIRTEKYNVYPYGDAGYECHGNFFAWLGPYQGLGRIDFTGATAKTVSMLTSTYYGTYLKAYDSGGNLLASDYAGPNTFTRTMTEITVTASSISYVIVHDTGNYWLIDDLRVRDLLRETNAFQPPDAESEFQTLDTIDKGTTSTYEFTNDQQQTLKILLNWQGSQLGIQILRPDGTIFYETESDSPPIRIVIPEAESGTWRIIVTAIDVPSDDYPFAIDVASIPPPTDIEPPTITVETPKPGQALQDGVTLEALVSDPSGVDWVTFSIREPNGEQGIIIDQMFESMPAMHSGDDVWQLPFDTYHPKLPDGYYVLLVKASDMLGNEGNETVDFSIRNWACLELLPATETNRAGRTMPVKFSLRVAKAVDPDEPFVHNEELTIKIYKKADPENILLQTSTFGIEARDYRIDSEDELYITNFKTLKKETTYVVEIWRMGTHAWLIDSFEFDTAK